MRRSILHYDVIDSTMKEYDRVHAIDALAEIVLVADRQSQGMGRSGNQWLSSYGGLWFTADLVHDEFVDSFALYIGACLHKVLVRLFPALEAKLRIKWPNDIYYQDTKLAGILSRYLSAENRYVVGIGVNTNNVIDDTELAEKSIRLFHILGEYVSNSQLRRLVLDEIENGIGAILVDRSYIAYCNRYLYGRDREAEVSKGTQRLSGLLRRIDSSGGVVLEDTAGERVVITGSLRLTI